MKLAGQGPRFKLFYSRNSSGPANTRSKIGASDFYLSHGRRALLLWIGSRTVMVTYSHRNAYRAPTRTRHLVSRSQVMERSGFAGCNDPVCASGNGPCEGHSGMVQPMNGYGVVEPIHEAVALEDRKQMEQERRHASSGEPMIAGLLFLAALVRQIVNDIRTWEPHALANGPIELHAVELFETRYSETPDHIGTVEVSYHADAKYSSIDGHLMMSASQWHALYGVTEDGRAVLYAN